MDNNYEGYLKLPELYIDGIVKRKVERLCKFYFVNKITFDVNVTRAISNELDVFFSNEDKIYFLLECINHLIKITNEHIQNCIDSECMFESNIQEYLYFFYGKLKDYEIDVRKDLFSFEEIQSNNEKKDTVIKKLTELQAGQEVIYNEIEEIKIELESAKSLQGLGKKRYYTYLRGVISKIKDLHDVWSVIKPLLQLLYPNNKLLN